MRKEEKQNFLPDFTKARANTLLRVVFNADLRCSHDGLALQAKALRLDVAKLEVGEFVVFINAKKTMLKMFAAGNTVAHFKTPGNRQLNLKVLAIIPRFFNGQTLKYDEALSEVIRKEIKR